MTRGWKGNLVKNRRADAGGPEKEKQKLRGPVETTRVFMKIEKDSPFSSSSQENRVHTYCTATHRPIYSSIGFSLCSRRIGNSPRWTCRSPTEWTRTPCWTRCPRPRAGSRRAARTSEWRPRYVLHPARCSPIPGASARYGADSRGSSTRCGSISWKLASGKA